MAAMENRDVANQNAATSLQGDRFVPETDRASSHRFILPCESAPVDHTPSRNRDIHKILPPDQAVMEIGVPAILVGDPLERFRRVIGLQLLWRAEDRRPGIKVKMDVALQMDAAAEIGAGRKVYRPSPFLRAYLNGLVDRRTVQSFPIPDGSELPHIVDDRICDGRRNRLCRERTGEEQSAHENDA